MGLLITSTYMRQLLALTCLFLIGCGSGLYRVTGKITFDGKPMVGGGAISFIPLGDKPGKAPGGEIAEDGTYTLMTDKPGDGSMLGEFRVAVTQTTVSEGKRTNDGERAGLGGVQTVPPDLRIPSIYADHYKSPLRATVEAKNPNELNFELKKQ